MKSKLKIAHFSDTHNRHKQVKWPILPALIDVAIFSGDMSGQGIKSEVENFFNWFCKIPCTYKIVVAGNHDRSFDKKFNDCEAGDKPEWLIETLKEFDWQGDGLNYYLENSGVTIEGVNFWGSPVTPWFHGERWAFNTHRGEAEIGEVWKKIPKDTDVLITHGPAYGFVDWGEQAQGPIGCEELRKTIKSIKPLLHLCGHIHEAYGYDFDADTNYFNGAICTLQYEARNAPWIIDADFEEREITILNDTGKRKEDKANEVESSGGETNGSV